MRKLHTCCLILFTTASLGGCGAETESARPALAQAVPTRSLVGMNVSGVIDWSSQIVFLDVHKASRPWMKSQSELEAVARDDRGNLRLAKDQKVEIYMLTLEGPYQPAGTYTATWKGAGGVSMSRFIVDGDPEVSPGRIRAKVKPQAGALVMSVTGEDPVNPVSDIKVWLPGFEDAKDPFYPPFLERLKPFGVLRFMDMGQTNNNPLVQWAERPRLEDARYSTERGVPIEVMVDLANRLQANPWFCVPHRADDNYVREFARLVRQRLDPKLTAYVEYSNEVWNGIFSQAGYAAEKGRQNGLSQNAFQAQLRYYSERSVEIFDIWEAEMGRGRIIRVMSAQAANPWTSEQVLEWKDAYKKTDSLAIAPYFGGGFGDPSRQEETAALSVDALLDRLEEEMDTENREMIRKQKLVADKFGVALVAYEGGQHLVGHGGSENNQKLTDLFVAANRSPRMYGLYRKHLNHWFTEGGGLFVAFSNVGQPSKWGSWGALEWQGQPIDQAPKYRALVDHIRGR